MFEYSSIEQYHAQLQEGSVSCFQAVEHYLQKISASTHLNAFIHVYKEEALQNAKSLDQQRNQNKKIGKLHGVVVGIKDVIAYKDHPLTASSKILKGFNSIYSSTVVEKLLAEEAIIIGNLNCDEFAMGSTNENSTYGKVLNALDETKVPGGSSGGSAVAVQAGLCMVSLGTDTGGSVRQPADFCGIAGLKPTYGRISRNGLVAYASSFDQAGILAKNVRDIAVVMESIAGPDEYDSTVSQKPVPPYSLLEKNDDKYRFAYFEEALDHPSLDMEIGSAIKKTIASLSELGHSIDPVSFDWMDYLVPAYYVLTTAEASSNLARYDGVRFGYRSSSPNSSLTEFYEQTRSEGFGWEVKRRIMLGTFVLSAGYYDAYYTRAQKVRRLVSDRIETIFKDYDFIIMPTVPATAFRFGEKMKDPVSMYLADIYTVMANLAGIPAISIPLYRHSNGMPFGLQVLAKRFDELPLLKVANQLMETHP